MSRSTTTSRPNPAETTEAPVMRRSVLGGVLGAAALVPLSTLTPAAAASSDIITASPVQRAADIELMLAKINSWRASRGAGPLTLAAGPSAIAQTQSDRTVAEERIRHTTVYATDPRNRHSVHGHPKYAGEVNAVRYQVDPVGLVQQFIDSPGHAAVLSDAKYTTIGLGVSYVDGALRYSGKPWRLAVVATLYGYGEPVTAAPSEESASVANGYELKGAIGAKYAALGGAMRLGAPRTPERPAAAGGVYQEFEKSGQLTTIYWHPDTRAHPVTTPSGIGSAWVRAGREHNYGFPSTDERAVTGGYYQVFTRAGRSTRLVWTSRYGAREVKEYGAIGRAWLAAGAERGYGFPVTDEYQWGSEIRQRFSNGYTVHFTGGRTWATR